MRRHGKRRRFGNKSGNRFAGLFAQDAGGHEPKIDSSRRLVLAKSDEGGWPPAMTLPAGAKQRLLHRAMLTALDRFVVGKRMS
jgi:hypothetical protein